MKKGELVALNIEVSKAAGLVLGAQPKIRALRDVFEADLMQFDITLIDKLETYCLVAFQADVLYRITTRGPEDLKALVAEALTLRAVLLSDVSALAYRGLLNKESISRLRGVNGYRNVASDLMALSALLRSRWEIVAPKSAVQEAEIERAEVLGERIIKGIGLRRSDRKSMTSFALERRQIFTLFVRAYEHVRRAVSYVRWYSNDLDEIAPSVYSGRSKRKRKAEPIIETASAIVPEASSVIASPVAIDLNGAKEKGPFGMPGADPFA